MKSEREKETRVSSPAACRSLSPSLSRRSPEPRKNLINPRHCPSYLLSTMVCILPAELVALSLFIYFVQLWSLSASESNVLLNTREGAVPIGPCDEPGFVVDDRLRELPAAPRGPQPRTEKRAANGTGDAGDASDAQSEVCFSPLCFLLFLFVHSDPHTHLWSLWSLCCSLCK